MSSNIPTRKVPTRTYLVEMFRDHNGNNSIRAHRGSLAESRDFLSPELLGAWVVQNASNKPEAIASVASIVNRTQISVHKVI